MKHIFVINPVAGKADKTSDILALARKAFAGRSDAFEIYVTKAPMDAARAIKRFAQQANGEELRIYSCGGDGTFNECVCGAAGLSNVAVAPFATGTGNDFIRMFGDEKQLFYDMDNLINGSVHPMDVMDCNGRICANICSIGFDARVGTDVHKYSNIPLIGGATGYVTSLIVNFAKGLTQKMHITGCGYDKSGEYTMVCICNGRFYGGGFNPITDAMPNDGVMDILVVNKVARAKAAGLVASYAKGQYYKMPQYITRLGGQEITMELDEESVVNIDGEAIYGKTINVKLVPDGVNFIVPRGMTFFDGDNCVKPKRACQKNS